MGRPFPMRVGSTPQWNELSEHFFEMSLWQILK